MKKVLRISFFILLAAVALGGAFVGFIQMKGIPRYDPIVYDLKVEVTASRVAQGAKLSSMLCRGCHAAQGNILTGKRMEDLPAIFGEIYTRNITQDPDAGIGKWSDGEISWRVLHAIPVI